MSKYFMGDKVMYLSGGQGPLKGEVINISDNGPEPVYHIAFAFVPGSTWADADEMQLLKSNAPKPYVDKLGNMSQTVDVLPPKAIETCCTRYIGLFKLCQRCGKTLKG